MRLGHPAPVRSQAQWEAVHGLIASGLNDCAVARATGIPRRTVMDWRHTVGSDRQELAGAIVRSVMRSHSMSRRMRIYWVSTSETVAFRGAGATSIT
jgi:hypothetical protein